MFKRLFDILAALFLIVVMSPIMALTAMAVRVGLGGPVLFRQPRPGKDGRPFLFIKFRTMTDARDSAGRLLTDEQRMTRLGRMLRASSLDELPQLLNVLKGDMSLVGPRPLLMEYLPLYTPEQSRRHEVRPGITGWAQVNGRNALSWEERFRLDVWYVDHQSFLLDLRILAITALRVLQARNVAEPGQATMTRFTGTPDV